MSSKSTREDLTHTGNHIVDSILARLIHKLSNNNTTKYCRFKEQLAHLTEIMEFQANQGRAGVGLDVVLQIERWIRLIDLEAIQLHTTRDSIPARLKGEAAKGPPGTSTIARPSIILDNHRIIQSFELLMDL